MTTESGRLASPPGSSQVEPQKGLDAPHSIPIAAPELIDIYRAEKIAQDLMCHASADEWDKSFVLVGPAGAINCEWLDPYFGIFQIEGSDGFVRTSAIPAYVKVLYQPAQAIEGDSK